MSKGRLLPMAMLLALNASTALAQNGWMRLGNSNIGTWQVYVKEGSVWKDAKGHVHVVVLNDYRVTMRGVDQFDEDGNISHTDTRYPHRSTVSTYVLNCAKRKEVSLRIQYYSGDMGTGRLVLDEKDSQPLWTDILFDLEPSLAKFACNPGNQAK